MSEEAVRDAFEGLPPIDVGGARLRDLSDQAIEAMKKANAKRMRFFQRGGALTRALTGVNGEITIEALEADSLRGELDRAADWSVTTKKDVKAVDAPLKVARDLLALKQYDAATFPALEAVAHAPFFDADYNLVVDPGYHEASRVYLHLSGLKVAEVPDCPGTEVVRNARDLLMEAFADFPFVSDADRAHILATLIYPYLCKAINTPPPGQLIDAADPGTGKGLLASVVVLINTGGAVEIIPPTDKDDSETRKRITALLLGGASYAVIDNVSGIIKDSSLAAALTADLWKDRILGSSRMVVLDNRTQWYFTGNNIRCTAEMARRFTRTRLEANVERPEERDGFLHDPLLDWVREQRSELVHAILTLIQNWVAKGRPEFTQRRLGSFERWGRIIGGVLVAAGITGFLEGREQMGKEVDENRAAWAGFIEAWFEKHQDTPVRVSTLLPLIDGYIDGYFTRTADLPRARETQLGNLLKARRGSVIAGHKLMPAEVIDDNYRRKPGWCLQTPKTTQPHHPSRNSQNFQNGGPEVGGVGGLPKSPLNTRENDPPTSEIGRGVLTQGRGVEKPLQNKGNSASNSVSPYPPTSEA